MNSIGKDLATIRLHLNLTLEEIHQTTRIPLDTLKRIENSSIFRDRDENIVYIRSFVRTYAKALKIDDEQVMTALDQYESGSYERSLLHAYPEISKKGAPPHPLLEDEEMKSSADSSTKPGRSQPAEESSKQQELTEGSRSAQVAGTGRDTGSGGKISPDSGSGPEGDSGSVTVSGAKTETGPAGSPGTGKESGTSPTGTGAGTPPSDAGKQSGAVSGQSAGGDTGGSAKNTGDETAHDQPKSGGIKSGSSKQGSGKDGGAQTVDWSKYGHQQTKIKKKTPAWIVGTIVIAAVLLLTSIIMYGSDTFSEETGLSEAEATSQEPGAETENSGLSLDLAYNGGDNRAADGERAAELDETLYITVYAAGDRLNPVRVWSDLKPRVDPYWMDQGQAYNFEFRDTIRISGSYSEMLLFLNGHRIDNFRQEFYNEEENAVELTREQFIPVSGWSEAIPLELPGDIAEPDSIQPRPSL